MTMKLSKEIIHDFDFLREDGHLIEGYDGHHPQYGPIEDGIKLVEVVFKYKPIGPSSIPEVILGEYPKMFFLINEDMHINFTINGIDHGPFNSFMHAFTLASSMVWSSFKGGFNA